MELLDKDAMLETLQTVLVFTKMNISSCLGGYSNCKVAGYDFSKIRFFTKDTLMRLRSMSTMRVIGLK